MKRIFIALYLVIGILAKSKANQVDTAYISTASLHRFDGTWEYTDDKITFKIVLKTEKVYNTIYNNYVDFVIGHHLYIKDGKEMQNSIGKKASLENGYFANKQISKNVLRFTFHDQGKSNSGHAIVELLPNGTLSWELKDLEGMRIVSKGKNLDKLDHNFYVPTKLILTKVK